MCINATGLRQTVRSIPLPQSLYIRQRGTIVSGRLVDGLDTIVHETYRDTCCGGSVAVYIARRGFFRRGTDGITS
jgi:hypothetical protein